MKGGRTTYGGSVLRCRRKPGWMRERTSTRCWSRARGQKRGYGIWRPDKGLQANQIRGLVGTVRELVNRIAGTDNANDLKEALSALAHGDSVKAEAEFEKVLEAQSSVAQSAAALAAEAGREAAHAARNIANLSLVSDVCKAVAYYRRAAALDAEDPETWRLLGTAYLTLGESGDASDACAQALHRAKDRGDAWEEMAAHVGLGDVALLREGVFRAQGWYEQAMLIARRRAREAVDDAGAQRDLSICQNKIGDVLVAQGDGAGALAAYRQGLAIAEALAARDPANTQWQCDLAVSCANLGRLGHVQTVDDQRDWLLRGREILTRPKRQGRLAPAQDWIEWFDGRLTSPSDQTGR